MKFEQITSTWIKLNAYWKATQTRKRWKLIVYMPLSVENSDVHGPETIHLTTAMEKKLNAARLRGICKILKKHDKAPTIVYVASTNKKLLEEANAMAYPSSMSKPRRQILVFSGFHHLRRFRSYTSLYQFQLVKTGIGFDPIVPLELILASGELGSPGRIEYTTRKTLSGKRRLEEHHMKKPPWRTASFIAQVRKDNAEVCGG